MKDLQLESPKHSASSSSSSSALSSTSHLSHHSLKKLLQCSDLDHSQRSDREHSNSCESVSVCSQLPKSKSPSPPKRETQEIKVSPSSNRKKGKRFKLQASGCSRFHSSLTLTVCLAGCVGSGAGRRGAPPPQRQKPRPAATATRENSTPKTRNPIIRRLFACQELQIKRLKNVIVELQNELENVKIENRTLKQVP